MNPAGGVILKGRVTHPFSLLSMHSCVHGQETRVFVKLTSRKPRKLCEILYMTEASPGGAIVPFVDMTAEDCMAELEEMCKEALVGGDQTIRGWHQTGFILRADFLRQGASKTDNHYHLKRVGY